MLVATTQYQQRRVTDERQSYLRVRYSSPDPKRAATDRGYIGSTGSESATPGGCRPAPGDWSRRGFGVVIAGLTPRARC